MGMDEGGYRWTDGEELGINYFLSFGYQSAHFGAWFSGPSDLITINYADTIDKNFKQK